MQTINFEEIAKAHSKGGKWNKSAVLACMAEVMEQCQAQQPKVGRTAGAGTVELRDKVKTFIVQAGRIITSKELSESLQAEQVEINNALHWLEKQNEVKRAGKAEHKGKGRKPVLWAVANS